mgnify:CR=1 FL=1
MIGGINPNSNLAYQAGNNAPARERSDVARAPASTADDSQARVRRDLADGSPATAESRPGSPSDSTDRRVEARRAAEDIRLERFRADDVPLSTSRALATFANVAAPSEAPDSLITGIDIRV